MAYIVYRKNKSSGAIYAYRQESYRDPITKKPRNRRTYLGRLDPETNTIIEKAPRTKSGAAESVNAENESPEIENLKAIINKKDEQIASLTEQLRESEKRVQYYRRLMEKINALTVNTENP